MSIHIFTNKNVLLRRVKKTRFFFKIKNQAEDEAKLLPADVIIVVCHQNNKIDIFLRMTPIKKIVRCCIFGIEKKHEKRLLRKKFSILHG